MKTTTILFDLDGTLIDSTEAILESFAAAYGAFSQPVPEADAIRALIGYPLDTMFLQLGTAPEAIEAHVAAYKRHYRAISRQKTRLLPGAADAIETASTFARLGIVTTKTARYSRELLEHMGLMECFEVLIGREDVLHPKPHPEPILRALEGMGAPKSGCWMVGDTPLDLQAARAAGVRSCGVACGYADAESLRAECEFLACDAREAVAYIGRLASEDGKSLL